MKLHSVSYNSDSGIKIYLDKTRAIEFKKIVPNFVQNATITYKIGLIKELDKYIKESYRIKKKHIDFKNSQIILSFQIDDLLKPRDSKLTLNSINFSFKDFPRIEFYVEQTYTFLELFSNFKKLNFNVNHNHKSSCQIETATKIHYKKENLQVNNKSLIQSSKYNENRSESLENPNKCNEQLFIDSFKKFRDKVDDSQFSELIKNKQSSIDFNLKNFAISLLCKLLLLVKYLNILVDNEIQRELNEFLVYNILNNPTMEEAID